MKTSVLHFLMATVWMGLAAFAQSQQQGTDRFSIPFSDPSRPGTVKVGLISGGITVKGYSHLYALRGDGAQRDKRD